MLVTACFVAAAATAVPIGPALLVRLVLVMLPLQFCIGVSNDILDREADAAAKPSKPLASGAVSLGLATAVAGGLLIVGLASAAMLPPPTVLLAAAGLGAGLAYNTWLKRSAWAWTAWWAGLAVLPLCARAAVQRLTWPLATVIPLAAGLALCLHLANSLPDIAGDAATGRITLAVRLGETKARRLMFSTALLTAALVIVLAALTGSRLALASVAAVLLALCAALVQLLRVARPFPALASAAAGLAALWLASLPPLP